MQPHAKLGLACNNLSAFSLLLHWLHMSLPKGALTLCHNAPPPPPAICTKGQYLRGLQR